MKLKHYQFIIRKKWIKVESNIIGFFFQWQLKNSHAIPVHFSMNSWLLYKLLAYEQTNILLLELTGFVFLTSGVIRAGDVALEELLELLELIKRLWRPFNVLPLTTQKIKLLHKLFLYLLKVKLVKTNKDNKRLTMLLLWWYL